MRQRLVVLLTVTLALVLLQPIATAAVKAGAKCSKAGATSISAGKKFTCVKSGNKLIWNKGAVIPKAASPKPSQSASVKFATAAEAEQNLGCYFEGEEALSLSGSLVCRKERWLLVEKENDSVQSRAYRFVLDRWNKQPEGNLTIDFYIDQTSGPWVNEIESGLRAGARFWGTSTPGSKAIPAFISSDPTFIEEALAKAAEAGDKTFCEPIWIWKKL